MPKYVFEHNANGSSSESESKLKLTIKTIENINRLSDFTSPLDTMKSKILFAEGLSETKATVDRMTLDDIYWLYEQITIKEKIQESYRYDIERQQQAAG